MIFSKSLMMNIHTTHHIYSIVCTVKKMFLNFFLREFSSAAPTLARRWSMHKPSISALNELAVGDFPRKTP